MRIYVVIPVHNRKAFTRDCLLSLQQQPATDFQTVVVDDGSTDGTSEMIEREFPNVILLHGNGNLWWTGAMNKGLRHVLGICDPEDYVLALNDDLIVPSNYIANCRKAALTHRDALVGSVVTDIEQRDTIRSGGIRIDWRTAKHRNVNAGKRLSSFPKDSYVEVSTLTGRGVLMPSRVLREIGLYDEDHFLQCGDTELPVRAAKAGYNLVVSYDMVVYSYAGDKGHINNLKEYQLANIRDYFWAIKSHTNLRDRFWFAHNTSSGILWGARYFLFDLTRVTFHFVSRLKLK